MEEVERRNSGGTAGAPSPPPPPPPFSLPIPGNGDVEWLTHDLAVPKGCLVVLFDVNGVLAARPPRDEAAVGGGSGGGASARRPPAPWLWHARPGIRHLLRIWMLPRCRIGVYTSAHRSTAHAALRRCLGAAAAEAAAAARAAAAATAPDRALRTGADAAEIRLEDTSDEEKEGEDDGGRTEGAAATVDRPGATATAVRRASAPDPVAWWRDGVDWPSVLEAARPALAEGARRIEALLDPRRGALGRDALRRRRLAAASAAVEGGAGDNGGGGGGDAAAAAAVVAGPTLRRRRRRRQPSAP